MNVDRNLFTFRCLAFFSIGLCAGVLHADEPAAGDTASSAELVRKALGAEARGDLVERKSLLDEAGNYEAAMWHSGMLLQGRNWKSVDESINDAVKDRRLASYLKRREGLGDDVESHLQLARWCTGKGLEEQSRAHLERVIAMEPDNVSVRRILGYQRLGSEWISPSEWKRLQDSAEFARNSLRKYRATMKRLRTQLSSKRPATNQLALETVEQLQGRDAVPALELILSEPDASHPFLQKGLACLATIDTVAASKSLSRFAVFHPEQKTRTLATSYLSDRPLHDFVPDLLQLLESPSSIMMTPIFDSTGNFRGYQQAFTKERMGSTDNLVVNRRFNPQDVDVRVRVRGDASIDDIEDAIEEATEEMREAVREAAEADAARRRQAAERENRYIEERNERVNQVISRVAGIPGQRAPLDLWKWWDQYNETNYQEFKPTSQRIDDENFAFRSYDIELDRTSECFVAGTMVVTQLGNRPIEELSVGDMVLSRNIGTGELDWKPVLRATNRPPERIVEVRTESDSLCCTGGHLFWVSGKGWQKASELEAGDLLHAAEEPTLVTSTRQRSWERTFNLQVADNATYFVGNDRVLTHDVTPRTHNRQTVPGEYYLRGTAEKE